MNNYLLPFSSLIGVVFIILFLFLYRRSPLATTTGFGTFLRRNGLVVSSFMILSLIGWLFFMIILPQLYMVDFSFSHNLPPSKIGGPEDVYTTQNYEYLLFGPAGDEESFNWLHLKVFLRTITAALVVTIIDFAICYPVAYYMAQVASSGRLRMMALCLLLPFWVNEILRAFAFRILLGSGGIMNTALMWLGLIDQPIDFIRADVALYSGLSYAYILLMIFPLYNAIESLDHNQIEAANDLGCPWWRVHFEVVIPFAKPGIASGCTMVFMLSCGALAAPQILGGPSSIWFTQIIYQWFNTGGNWPQGAAYAFVLLLVCIVLVMAVMKLFKVSFGEIVK